jgi:hypothetical protein
VFYAATTLKKLHFICSSAAPLAKPAGNNGFLPDDAASQSPT